MDLSEFGEDAGLQTAAAEVKAQVQNDRSKDRALFDLDSLPPGQIFNPKDAVIIVYYLRKKVDHQPLPPNKIIEVNLYAYDPEQLAVMYEPNGDDEWFYFTPRDRKYPNGKRPNRSVPNGYWKATGADKEIKFEDRMVGYRKALVFYRGSAPDGVKTNWIMHEFRVAEPPQPRRRTGVDDKRLDDCVLCRINKKDRCYRGTKRSRGEPRNDEPRSGSKIPRLELNPNPNEANNQLYGGMDSIRDWINYQYNNPFINSHQALQNQHQRQQPIIQMPQIPPQDNLQVLPPPAGTDVSIHSQNINLMQSMEFPYSDNPWDWDDDFYSSNIHNTDIVSTMDLKPDYMPRGNMGGNTGSANIDSTTMPMPRDNQFFSSPRL